MKKFWLLSTMLMCLFLVGCWDNTYDTQKDFEMKEKCSKYSEKALEPEFIEAWYTLLTDFDKTNHGAIYSKELNTCLAYVEWGESFWPHVWDGDEWYIRRIVVDALTNQVYVDCHANTKGWIETERYEEYDSELTKEQIEAFEHFKCYNLYHEYIK